MWPTAACWTRRCCSASRTSRRRRRSSWTSSRSTRSRAPTTTPSSCSASRCSRAHDPYSSRHYFEMFLQRNTGVGKEQDALQRLIEISFRTGDYEHVDDYLAKLQNIPPERLEPATPYVRAKLFYFRGKDDDALAGFSALPTSNPYYFQARYFIATIMVKKGDLAGASTIYDSTLTKEQAPDDSARRSRTSAAWRSGASSMSARSSTRPSTRTSRSRASRSTSPRRSTSRPGRTSRPRSGKRPGDRSTSCCSSNPDMPDAPDKRLLLGQPPAAHRQLLPRARRVRKVRDEFDPIQRQLQAVIVHAADRSRLLRQPRRPQPGQVRHLGVRAAGRRRSGSRPSPTSRA